MVTMRSLPSRSDGFRSPCAVPRILELDGDGPILEDDFVGAALDRENRPLIDGAAFQVDRGARRAEVEAHRMQRIQLLEHGREQVLAGVLLHVVEAARPIDRARNFVRRHRCGQAVRDAFVLIRDFATATPPSVPRSIGLTAGGRIEGGAVEVDGGRRQRSGRQCAR